MKNDRSKRYVYLYVCAWYLPDVWVQVQFKFRVCDKFFLGVLILNQRGYEGGKIGENSIGGRIKWDTVNGDVAGSEPKLELEWKDPFMDRK